MMEMDTPSARSLQTMVVLIFMPSTQVVLAPSNITLNQLLPHLESTAYISLLQFYFTEPNYK
jgi:hypothetical protein